MACQALNGIIRGKSRGSFGWQFSFFHHSRQIEVARLLGHFSSAFFILFTFCFYFFFVPPTWEVFLFVSSSGERAITPHGSRDRDWDWDWDWVFGLGFYIVWDTYGNFHSMSFQFSSAPFLWTHRDKKGSIRFGLVWIGKDAAANTQGLDMGLRFYVSGPLFSRWSLSNKLPEAGGQDNWIRELTERVEWMNKWMSAPVGGVVCDVMWVEWLLIELGHCKCCLI